ncbi:hypothetical protein EV127DRAFT_411281 [Xylaria flabelliformis]|nr:hypothetical protein EV127DRAFT_411281 [Xylaria flabelliformis]
MPTVIDFAKALSGAITTTAEAGIAALGSMFAATMGKAADPAILRTRAGGSSTFLNVKGDENESSEGHSTINRHIAECIQYLLAHINNQILLGQALHGQTLKYLKRSRLQSATERTREGNAYQLSGSHRAANASPYLEEEELDSAASGSLRSHANRVLFPIFTKDFADNYMAETITPVIMREPVHEVFLKIKAAAFGDKSPNAGRTTHFDWLDAPGPEQHIVALQELTASMISSS